MVGDPTKEQLPHEDHIERVHITHHIFSIIRTSGAHGEPLLLDPLHDQRVFLCGEGACGGVGGV